jgi:hypothetical protein
MTAQTKTDSLLNGADTISIPETNSLLAEHMLPDGAHDRSDDWTIFYLNQIPPLTTKSGQPSNHDNGRGSSRANRGYDRYGDDAGTNLLYVISLVRTKKVATVRRGALVKALAIAVRYPYIQIYKVNNVSSSLLLAVKTFDIGICSLHIACSALGAG